MKKNKLNTTMMVEKINKMPKEETQQFIHDLFISEQWNDVHEAWSSADVIIYNKARTYIVYDVINNTCHKVTSKNAFFELIRDIERLQNKESKPAPGPKTAEYIDDLPYGLPIYENMDRLTIQKLGIVYTPVEVVDFTVHSCDDQAKAQGRRGLDEPYVEVIDPFAGLGIFLVRAIKLGLLGHGPFLTAKIQRDILFMEILPDVFGAAALNIHQAAVEMGALNLTVEDVLSRGICGDTFLQEDEHIRNYFPDNRW